MFNLWRQLNPIFTDNLVTSSELQMSVKRIKGLEVKERESAHIHENAIYLFFSWMLSSNTKTPKEVTDVSYRLPDLVWKSSWRV